MCKTKVIAGTLIMIALAGLPAGVQAQWADDGLVAEWHFDEGSGSVLHDNSGNDGVIHGATWADWKDYVLFGDAVSESGEAGISCTGRLLVLWMPGGAECGGLRAQGWWWSGWWGE